MKKYALYLLLMILFLHTAGAYAEEWQVTKSTHFIINYKNAPQDFVDTLVEKSEYYYDRIAEDLGFMRLDFWLWDNRAKIYIYDDAASYQSATGQPDWSSGCALIQAKIISTFPYAEGFFDTVLPHEMGHIIFREFVGFNNYAVPIWLDEGVASYQEKDKVAFADTIVKGSLQNGNFIGLNTLSTIRPQFLQNKASVSLFYAESVSIVKYLVKEFGRDKFVLFCQNLRDEKKLERAISMTYPFENLKELEDAWKQYLNNG